MELRGLPKRYSGVQTFRSILSALGIVAVIFAVPVVATLVAGQFGLSFRLIGWVTLLAMMLLAFQWRGEIGRLLGAQSKLARVAAIRQPRRRS